MKDNTIIKTMLELIPSPFYVKNPSGRYTDFNDAFMLLTGLSRKEITGKTSRDVFPEAFAEMDEFHDRLLLEQGVPADYETELTLDEETMVFRIRKTLLTGISESSGCIACVLNDITREHHIGEELRVYRRAMEQSPASIVITDREGTIQYVNPAFTRVTGYTFDEALGQNPRILKSGMQSPALYREMWETILDGRDWKGEFHNRKKNGEVYWEIASVSPIRDQAGVITSFIAVKEDISHLKKIEDVLRQAEEKNREILDSIPDIMFKLNREGNFLDLSLEKRIRKIFPDEVRLNSIPLIGKAFDSADIQIFEYPVIEKKRTQHYEARFIISGEEEILVIIRDITDRVAIEEELRKAKEAAEHASRTKGDFLANMSHEIRTPLNSIHGFIELMKKTKLDDVQTEYLDIVSRSAENLLGIINDILDFSKIESGKIEIENIPFNPIYEFAPTLEIFTERALEKNISLYSFIDPLLPHGLSGDPLRIKQVLINLLSNAIKFTPRGGKIFVEIRMKKISESRCSVFFSVRDTGIGVPERKMKLIFESFAQVDNSVTRRFGGTGLGLSISNNLVSLMGSELLLASVPGKGSSFHFTLDMEAIETSAGQATLPGDIRAFIHCPDSSDPLVSELLERYLDSWNITRSRINSAGEITDGPGKNIVFITADPAADTTINELIMSFRKTVGFIVLVSEKMTSPASTIQETGADRIIYSPLNPSKVFNCMIELFDPGSAGPYHSHLSERGEVIKINARALVAEDNPVNQKLITLLLLDYGITTDVASNGLDAFYFSGEREYDIIFMDINMPVTDGMEATRMIINREKETGLPHVPIVALTAMAMQGDRERFIEAGMDDYITKPIEIGKLRSVLVSLLSHLVTQGSITAEKEAEPPQTVPDRLPQLYNMDVTATELGIPASSLRKIMVDFILNSDEYISAMEKARDLSDFSALAQAAHRLRGAAANLRLGSVAEISGTIENGARKEESLDYVKLISEIDRTLKTLREYITGNA